MIFENIPPAFFLLGAALLLPFLPRSWRATLCVLAPAAGLWHLASYDEYSFRVAEFSSFELILLNTTDLSLVFGIIFLLVCGAAALFSWHNQRTSEQAAALLYGSGALGVTFAGDYLTLLVFWEIMALASTWLVVAGNTASSRAAAYRYLLAHLLGGSLLLAGIAWRYFEAGHLIIGPLTSGESGSGWLILAGVGLNAAVLPLHAWLPDAYPRASVTGAVFLSALTTKTAVYVLIKVFPGWEILTWLGLGMVLFGVFYAVLCNDIRQILSYHIVSQVGFMVCGVGLGTALSLNGATAHAFCHILYKALLFMSAGAILQASGTAKLSELRGLRHHLPWTCLFFLVGAVSISGFPFFNGFVSKSMILEGAASLHRDGVLLLLLLGSVGTFLSIGLKIPAIAFAGTPGSRTKIQPLPPNMYLAMAFLSCLCLGLGIWPDVLYQWLPYRADYNPFTLYHFMETVHLLTFTFVGFWWIRKSLQPKNFIVLDVDWLYRKALRPIGAGLLSLTNVPFEKAQSGIDRATTAVVAWFRNPLDPKVQGSSVFQEDRERVPLLQALVLLLLVFLLLVVIGKAGLWWSA